MGLTWGKSERYNCSSIRGNHMNFGGPSPAGLSDRLRSPFYIEHPYHQDAL